LAQPIKVIGKRVNMTGLAIRLMAPANRMIGLRIILMCLPIQWMAQAIQLKRRLIHMQKRLTQPGRFYYLVDYQTNLSFSCRDARSAAGCLGGHNQGEIAT
jgi:hypothetical protein